MGRLLFRHRLALLVGAFLGVLGLALTQRRWADAGSAWQRPLARLVEAEGATTAVLIGSGLVCLLAFLLRTAAEARLRDVVYGQGRIVTLIESGPFAWTRNPLYLGTGAFLSAAMLLWAPAALWLAASLGLAGALHAIVRHEETILAEQLGPSYRAYLDRVPRWLPRPPSTPSSEPAPPARAWAWAALGNLGFFSLGAFRLGVALGGPVGALGLLNLALLLIWVGVLAARRLRFGGAASEA
jgi:protein-S-isoprenylcysteine O-methyltransferase Ste14